MIDNVVKTIPSEDVWLAWIGGIIDGEGSIGVYRTKQGRDIMNVSIVNSDIKILNKVEEIFKKYKIFYCKYLHTNRNPKGFLPTQPCYVITVRRKDDSKKILELVFPYLIGKKKELAQKLIDFVTSHPKHVYPTHFCIFCKKEYKGRTKKYCSLECWHKYAVGKNNPNFLHGKYIACND